MTMQELSHRLHHLMQLTTMVLTPVVDAVRFLRLCLRSPTTLRQKTSFALLPMSVPQWPGVPAPGGPTLSKPTNTSLTLVLCHAELFC